MPNPLTSEERARLPQELRDVARWLRLRADGSGNGYARDCERAAVELARTADDARDGIGLIAIERRRQVEAEGWTPEHDAEHYNGELASAAACYAEVEHKRRFYSDPRMKGAPIAWPWDWVEWKPTPENRIRELVKAGALIAAEIDRLQRAALASSKSEAAEGGEE